MRVSGLGFSDVGPSGVVLFGEKTMSRAREQKVGWYKDGHASALVYNPKAGIDNRQHLLNFAIKGTDLSAGEALEQDSGWMKHASRLISWLAWPIVIFVSVVVLGVFYLIFRTLWAIAFIPLGLFVIYVALDIL
jgi:hypothetical protein